MPALTHGPYVARTVAAPQDMAAVLALRSLCFRGGLASDADAFDALCQHVAVMRGDEVVATYRVQTFAAGQGVQSSYAAQTYDLTGLQQAYSAPMIELGRFCLHPSHPDPDILRLAWASMTRLVDRAEAGMLFGCTSFAGADPARHRTAFGHLAQHHLGPAALRPAKRAAETVDLIPNDAPVTPGALPPLLRTYLAMGGWVSDHAVLDRDLDTAHVFTALDISAIPAARARALRLLAHSGS